MSSDYASLSSMTSGDLASGGDGERSRHSAQPGKTTRTSGFSRGGPILRKRDDYSLDSAAGSVSSTGSSTRAAESDPFGLHLLPGGTILRSAAGPTSDNAAEIFGAATGGAGSEVPFRAEMEYAFGEDFSGVSVHVGQGRAMQALGAHAAAQGEKVAFATTSPTKELVAHELTHVVQNRRGGLPQVANKAVSNPSDASELEADAVAAKVAAGQRVEVAGAGGKERGACSCAGAGCAACSTTKAASPSEALSRSIVHRAAVPPESGAGGPAARAATDQAIALLAGPARHVAQQTGSPAAAAERSAVINQALARLSQAGGEAPKGDQTAAPAAEDRTGSEQLTALVNELHAGFARRAPQSPQAPHESDGDDQGPKRPTAEGQHTKPDPTHTPEAAQHAQPAAGVIQRQVVTPPPFDCNDLLQQIIEFLNVLKQRSAELIADAQGLQWNHWGVGDAHPDFGSVVGHQDQFRGRQRGLRNRLNDWNRNNCGDGLPADAWDWATRPAPNPTPRPNPATQRAVETVAVGVGVGVGVYAAYRVLRMIPSLFPPLWWSIPANAAIP